MQCRVAAQEDMGNGLFATDACEPGSVVLTERPLVFVLSWKRADLLCDYCFAPATLRCTVCRSVKYCSAKCQRAAWKQCLHKGECRLLAAGVVTDSAMDNVRMCVRLAWRLREREEDSATLCPLDRATLDRVESMAAQSRDPQHYVDLGVILVARTLVWMEPAAVTRLLLVLQTNAMRVPDGSNGTPLAVGLYAYGSAANHSCSPSAIAAFSKCTLELIVCRPLTASDCAITVGYIDVSIPKRVRRFLLYDSWNFSCACRECSELDESLAGEIICADCGKRITCSNDALTWELFESLGDSEWYCGSEPKKRFFQFCAETGPVRDPHTCGRACAGAEEAISLASKASQAASVSHKPRLRFAELVWQLVWRSGKKLLVERGYFWRCAALRFALHCVNVAQGASDEDTLPMFESAARLNEQLWRSLEHSWQDGPLALGCVISQIRCDAWCSSYKMEKGIKAGLSSEEHAIKATDSIRLGQKMCTKIFGKCQMRHTLVEDMVRTIDEIVKPL